MSRLLLNEKYCRRCNRLTPTPFLRSVVALLPTNIQQTPTALDIGCGNGRNAAYLQALGFKVTAIDMIDSLKYTFPMLDVYPRKLGHDTFPGKTIYDVVLANYVFMFLNERERQQVFNQIQQHTTTGSALVIECYAAKDAYPYDFELNMMDWFILHDWKIIRLRREKKAQHALLYRE